LHPNLANAIRFLAIDAVEKAKSGHPGMPMGMADVVTVLFTAFPQIDRQILPGRRDRFVLSAVMARCAIPLLHLTGTKA